MKKAQATIFIILGILILIVLALALYLTGIGKQIIPTEQLILPEDVDEINNQIDDCFEELIDFKLEQIWNIDNTYTLSNQSLLEIEYPLYTQSIPSLDQIKTNLENDLTLSPCFIDTTTEQLPQTKVTLNSNTKIQIKNLATISFDNTTYTLPEERNFERNFNIKELHTFVQTILENKEILDFELLLDSNYEVSVLRPEENIVIYIIEDPSFEINNLPYQFAFAIEL
ncbi:hypothetical protein CL616_01555 [archaeon]|nr:hypothetical protein [archaeon]|tara:strand:- start:1090 stop:1770 length:681 start_codon:yes stop_codon:yes gene_type:complete